MTTLKKLKTIVVKIIMKKSRFSFHCLFLPFYVENENLLISQRVSHFDKAKSCTCRMWNKSHRVAELSDSYYSPSRTAFFLRGLLLFKNSSSTTRDQRKEWIRKNSEWPAAPKNAKRWGRARQE